MNPFFKNFNLKKDKESYADVIERIERDTDLFGANLWILIFAIFVASLGLNVNSTAVIIGAMLISPLMGPIMGLGVAVGINDLALLRKSLSSYLFAAGVGLATSTIYFAISPINSAHSEIFSRISPNIYDVLIAFFGGLAGIVAASFKHKGNVIPGVAIATALMPPLCTAGYGLATLNMAYFFGAFYLFVINTVFIALSTLLVVRLLGFPYKQLIDQAAEIKAKRIVWAVAILTLLPSVYLGYDIVQKERFTQNAARFIQAETSFPNCYLLEKSIDPKKKSISLIFGGKKITETEIEQLKNKLQYYNIAHATLTVRQGFEYLSDTKPTEKVNPLQPLLAKKENELLLLKAEIDSLHASTQDKIHIRSEAKALYPNLLNMALTEPQQATKQPDKEMDDICLIYLQYSKLPSRNEKHQIQKWLEARLDKKVKLVVGK